MPELPRKVDKKVRRFLATLDCPWEVVQKKNHYFAHIGDQPPVCIAGNGSRLRSRQLQFTLCNLKRAALAAENNDAP